MVSYFGEQLTIIADINKFLMRNTTLGLVSLNKVYNKPTSRKHIGGICISNVYT